MKYRWVLALVCVAGVAACVQRYTGAGRTTSHGELATQQGWIFAPAPVVRQRSDADCGPTALAMVAARWGLLGPDRSSERASNVAFITLRDHARMLGLSAFVISASVNDLEHEVLRDRPVIVGLYRPYGNRYVRGHYEVVVGWNPLTQQVATIDPASGWRVRTLRDFEREWKPANSAAMVILRPRQTRATAR